MTLAQAPMHGVAVDAGSGLGAALQAARGACAAPDDLRYFKRAVLTGLGPGATTVLLDCEYGPGLLADYPAGCAPMLAHEADAYRISGAERITVLPDHLSIADYPALGVRQLKFFMYYAPDDDPALNERKEGLVATLGEQCRSHGLRFLMEPLVYHPTHAPGSAAFAAVKPELVRRAVQVFSDPRFFADVLKIEVPVDLAFVEGHGEPQRTRAQAQAACRDVATAAGAVPCVYLSAGVPFERFEAALVLAREAGAGLAGFMCGRALWSDAIGVFGAHGEAALTDWLSGVGRARLTRLIAAL